MVIFVMEVLLLIYAGNYLEAEWMALNADVQIPHFSGRAKKELEIIRRPNWYERCETIFILIPRNHEYTKERKGVFLSITART